MPGEQYLYDPEIAEFRVRIISTEQYDISTFGTTPVRAEPFDFAQDKLRPQGEVETRSGTEFDVLPPRRA